MTARVLAVAVLAAALVVVALPGGAVAANECNGVSRCIPVEGPWVAVPASGEVEYELSCPQGKGVIAGTDGLASSVDIHVSFDAILGAPIAYGRTTSSQMLFRGVSGRHRTGAFKPFIGCIPSPSSVRNTIATARNPVGPPLDMRSRLVSLSAGDQKVVTLSCPAGEALVDSWGTPAFESAKAPTRDAASAIAVRTTVSGRKAMLEIRASEALPDGAGAEVQVGVRCALQ